ncbi:MAG: hypothetical protein DI539_22550 [Flavobacterium psychrophilum]|nr:MAG: hypothetical protein DI539_22550 [Flavobacterium psychrophilum]
MKPTLKNQKALQTKYADRYVAAFPINLPAEQIDLSKWFREMMQTDYVSYSPAHIAMNTFTKDGILYSTNVENIGLDQIVQHYSMRYETKSHILLHSSKSDVYIMRYVPVSVGVPWEMQIRPVTENTSEFTCMFGIDYPNRLLKTVFSFYGLGGIFLKKHLKREGVEFAKDIERKFSMNN